MKPILSISLGLLVLWAAVADAKKMKDATANVTVGNWLQLIDADNDSAAYEATSNRFKSIFKQDAFIESQKKIRMNYGRVTDRKVIDVKYYPADPNGETSVFIYKVTFSNGQKMVETVRSLSRFSQSLMSWSIVVWI